MGKIIAYYRVSTVEQSDSGLGLESQLIIVGDYALQYKHEIIASYQEIETGKKADRPELAKAIMHAKRAKATLIIAKLDRLARNVHFLSGLMESKVDFVCCDNPHANRLTLHILAAVAEDEARAISERTKSALAAYKARGGVLGKPENMTQEAAQKGADATRNHALTAYAIIMPELRSWRGCGMSYQAIAELLNANGKTTRTGLPWNPVQVWRILKRETVR